MSALLIKAALNSAQSEYLKWLPKWLLATAAAGAGARGALGLKELVSSNVKRPAPPPQPMMINIPYRAPGAIQDESDEEKVRERFPSLKVAGVLDWLGGSTARSPGEIPASWAANILGGGAAAYGGYSLMDKLLDKRKQKTREQEIEDARREYEQSLMDQFRPAAPSKIRSLNLRNGPVATKLSSARPSLDPKSIQTIIDQPTGSNLAANLDKLAESYTEKQADIHALMHKIPAGYFTLAALGALGTGAGVYHYTKQFDPRQAVADEVRRQADERWMRKPPEMFARLVPVDAQGRPVQPRKERPRPEESFPSSGDLGTGLPSSKMGSVEEKAAAFIKDMFGG